MHFINVDGVSVRDLLFYERQCSLKFTGRKGGEETRIFFVTRGNGKNESLS